MRIVVALGGNALLQRGEPPDSEVQAHHIVAAVDALAPIAREHELVVTHGNGPQIGLLALESARDPSLSHPYPLDVLGAQTQGMVGYWLLQALENAVPDRLVACVVTQTLVDAADPAWDAPSKFIGPVYDENVATRLADERGWQLRVDGPAWRRVWSRRRLRWQSWRSPSSSYCSRRGRSWCVRGVGERLWFETKEVGCKVSRLSWTRIGHQRSWPCRSGPMRCSSSPMSPG